MKIPYGWLKEFVVLDIQPHELARRLTMKGLEVESVEEINPRFKGVVVGEILSVEQHPEGGNLTLCTVNTGKENCSIVCGAKNIKKGQRIPVALVGSVLADGTIIEAKTIKGMESHGMLCSEKELGLSDDHSGICILPEHFEIGKDLNTIAEISDIVLDINVPPNRGDCLSVYGIAREVASIVNQKAKLPSFEIGHAVKDIKNFITLDVADTEACPRYILRMIKGISIVPSPYWMKSRIMKCGMRPINSIVDVTNYVMLELGQPLHAFDYERLEGKRVEVRLAEKETSFTTLDEIERRIEAGDILICDGSGPVAIAGIMGGKDSEITEDTKHVALESAYFNPLYIRRTARRLGLKSEASIRFEKGIDINNVDFAAKRAVSLMNQLSGGTIIKGKKEIREKQGKRAIYVSFERIDEILGTTVKRNEIINALESIEVKIIKDKKKGLVVSIPSFRHDLNEYMDLIEEIARIYGYEHIPATIPVAALQLQKRSRKDIFLNEAKDYFRSSGFFEFINYTFFSVGDIEKFLIPVSDKMMSYVNIMNPISKEYGVMRTFIAAGVLKNIAYNVNRGIKNLRCFEVGKVFFKNTEGTPYEYTSICFALTGKERDFFWRETYSEYDFFDIKGVLEGFMKRFEIDFSIRRSQEPFLNNDRAADIFIEEQKVGWVGEIKEDVLKAYEIEQKVYCSELRFDIIIEKGRFAVKFSPIPRYPQVIRDFSFFVDEAIPVSTLIQHIKKISPLITSVGIFDMYKKEARSISLRVVFQSYEDTLQDTIINNLQETIIKELTGIKGVTLRT